MNLNNIMKIQNFNVFIIILIFTTKVVNNDVLIAILHVTHIRNNQLS